MVRGAMAEDKAEEVGRGHILHGVLRPYNTEWSCCFRKISWAVRERMDLNKAEVEARLEGLGIL